MNAVISKKETIISYTIAILFTLAMVTAGVLLNDPEVILPEIAAMAIALWAYRESGWLRQPEKIFVAPSITALIGFAVNQMDLAYIGKVSVTLVLMMLFLRVIQSNLAPSIATGFITFSNKRDRMVVCDLGIRFNIYFNDWCSYI